MRIDAVLLDAGGVLLDESEMESTRAHTTAEVLARHVPGYTVAQYREDLEEAVHAFCANAYHFVFWKRLRPDRELYERTLAEFAAVWRSRRPPLRLMDGIADELASTSQRHGVGLAGQYGAEVLDLLERKGLLELLSWRHTQDDFRITKPDPRYLLEIAAACGVEPAHCVMVGDRIDKDVLPARQVGMRTIRIRVGVHRNQRPRVPEESPDVELPSVTGLAEAIEGLESA